MALAWTFSLIIPRQAKGSTKGSTKGAFECQVISLDFQ
jgi:hypothetical protein